MTFALQPFKCSRSPAILGCVSLMYCGSAVQENEIVVGFLFLLGWFVKEKSFSCLVIEVSLFPCECTLQNRGLIDVCIRGIALIASLQALLFGLSAVWDGILSFSNRVFSLSFYNFLAWCEKRSERFLSFSGVKPRIQISSRVKAWHYKSLKYYSMVAVISDSFGRKCREKWSLESMIGPAKFRQWGKSTFPPKTKLAYSYLMSIYSMDTRKKNLVKLTNDEGG